MVLYLLLLIKPKTVIRKPKTPTEYHLEGYDVGY